MATILEFPLQATASTGRASRASAASAEIVLFPGIRYEYHDEPVSSEATEAKPQRGATRKRDRLEIAD